MVVVQTPTYTRWFENLRDLRAQARVVARITRLATGNMGDVRSVGGGVRELRIDYGPGYRIYFTQRGLAFVLLLTGGDKSRQQADIARARELAAHWEDE
jgi:putative addiction module killer protein